MRAWLTWAWNDLREGFNSLEGAKVMGGLLFVPIAFGVAYEFLKALGLQH